jgi:hypothetical protein
VALPLLISFLATLAAGVMAYGTDARWVEQGSWGLGLIVLSRRLQWPLVAVSLLLCLSLVALVISGKRRAWWLIALLPVLALFVHRFLTAPTNRYDVLDSPAFVAAAEAQHVRDEDYVVGVIFNEQPYAYPYAALFRTPIVVQSDREKRMVLIWSAFANAATPMEVSREVKARDLDIVCDPMDTLLIYNGRTGQFIVGLTGQTHRGAKPAGFEAHVPAITQTWRQWRTAHPATRVLMTNVATGPTQPLAPHHGNPNAATPQVIVTGDGGNLSIQSNLINASPINVKLGDTPAVIFRDAASGRVKAFDRRLEQDLIPQFKPPADAKLKSKGVVMTDTDTGSAWDARGVAVDGPKDWRGKKLRPINLREDIHRGPSNFWYRDTPGYVP